MSEVCESVTCGILSTTSKLAKMAPGLPRHSIQPSKSRFGNWQFSLALESQCITHGEVWRSKPSLDLYVWRSKFKVLLGVSAKISSFPSILFLGKSSGSLQQWKRRISTKPVDYVRRYSSRFTSATQFYFKSRALVTSDYWWDYEKDI